MPARHDDVVASKRIAHRVQKLIAREEQSGLVLPRALVGVVVIADFLFGALREGGNALREGEMVCTCSAAPITHTYPA